MTLAEKQPVTPVTFVSRNEIDCPWCMADNSDTAGFHQTECAVCRKPFEIDIDAYGAALAKGVITEADKAYMEWRAGQS